MEQKMNNKQLKELIKMHHRIGNPDECHFRCEFKGKYFHEFFEITKDPKTNEEMKKMIIEKILRAIELLEGISKIVYQTPYEKVILRPSNRLEILENKNNEPDETVLCVTNLLWKRFGNQWIAKRAVGIGKNKYCWLEDTEIKFVKLWWENNENADYNEIVYSQKIK